MLAKTFLEGAGGQYLKGGAREDVSPGRDALATRVEALKVLIAVLMKEVEALGEDPRGVRGEGLNLSAEVRRFEATLIRYALARTGGHQRQAARLLNVNAATLNVKIKRYKLNADEFGEAERK